MIIEYDSNDSGGDWWLSDEDWHNLEKAGWKVDWEKDKQSNERWLGALATSAIREGLSMDEAIEEFEKITGQSQYDAGCECCGPPHNFYKKET